MELEIKYWKVHRFAKDKSVQEAVKQVLLNNAVLLKSLYIELTANSNYPGLGSYDFVEFVKNLGLMDK